MNLNGDLPLHDVPLKFKDFKDKLSGKIKLKLPPWVEVERFFGHSNEISLANRSPFYTFSLCFQRRQIWKTENATMEDFELYID